MEAALDSPLEALAFNYLSYGLLTAVNNIWPWLAVVTAAVSFWRIRVLSTPIAAATVPEMVEEIIAAVEEEQAAAPARSAPCVVAEGQGITKMKFSLYYAEEDEEEEFGGDDGGESEECGGAGAGVGDWEGVIAMRMGDMGWYRWQDRTVLSGNVVRLWEGRRRRHAAAKAVDGGFVWLVGGTMMTDYKKL
ncbi:hypothetical protein SASPL_109710 [Salvia splendens]|uniref:Uncharacterized protein n=1 Tax=Salvia splendens TaxID=180675 RepID=A0A8X8YFM5_SALSN|nr:uncharacterized protein LOC121793978 [Salvia splendens]KAG6431631.1 hypothetical protein SASPL_109710 [Salvia splendens]